MKTLFPQSVKTRPLRMEPLEERQMLSVSAAEFGAVRSQYPDLNLPANISDYNVIEITASQLTATNLQNAVNTAAPLTVSDTPANVTAAAVSTKTVLLTWDAVANAESYKVYCYDSTVAGGWRLLANVAGTSWTQGGYTPGATYAFRVSAVNAAGESALSPTVKATMVMPALPPATPTNFVAGAVNTKTVLLTWDAVPWAESYNVYCYDSTVAGGWRLLANVTGTSWTQGGYTPGGTYAFRVSAVNTYGVSPLSETKKATMIAPPLAAPMTQALLSYLNEEFLI